MGMAGNRGSTCSDRAYWLALLLVNAAPHLEVLLRPEPLAARIGLFGPLVLFAVSGALMEALRRRAVARGADPAPLLNRVLILCVGMVFPLSAAPVLLDTTGRPPEPATGYFVSTAVVVLGYALVTTRGTGSRLRSLAAAACGAVPPPLLALAVIPLARPLRPPFLPDPIHGLTLYGPPQSRALALVIGLFFAALLAGELIAMALVNRIRESAGGLADCAQDGSALLAQVQAAVSREAPDSAVLSFEFGLGYLDVSIPIADLVLSVLALVPPLFPLQAMLYGSAMAPAGWSFLVGFTFVMLVHRRHALSATLWGLMLVAVWISAPTLLLPGVLPAWCGLAGALIAAALAALEIRRRGSGWIAVHIAGRVLAFRLPVWGAPVPVPAATLPAGHRVDLATTTDGTVRVKRARPEVIGPVLSLVAVSCLAAVVGFNVLDRGLYVQSVTETIGWWNCTPQWPMEVACERMLAAYPDERTPRAFLADIRCAQRRYADALRLAAPTDVKDGSAEQLMSKIRVTAQLHAALPDSSRALWDAAGPGGRAGLPDRETFVALEVAAGIMFPASSPVPGVEKWRTTSSLLEALAWIREAVHRLPEDEECLTLHALVLASLPHPLEWRKDDPEFGVRLPDPTAVEDYGAQAREAFARLDRVRANPSRPVRPARDPARAERVRAELAKLRRPPAK